MTSWLIIIGSSMTFLRLRQADRPAATVPQLVDTTVVDVSFIVLVTVVVVVLGMTTSRASLTLLLDTSSASP